MAEKDGLTELAKLFKERNNQHVPSVTTGIVEARLYMPPAPEIRVRISDVVALDETNIIVSEHIYAHYEHFDISRGVPYWLENGEEVILLPVMDEQLYFMMDKARRLD